MDCRPPGGCFFRVLPWLPWFPLGFPLSCAIPRLGDSSSPLVPAERSEAALGISWFSPRIIRARTTSSPTKSGAWTGATVSTNHRPPNPQISARQIQERARDVGTGVVELRLTLTPANGHELNAKISDEASEGSRKTVVESFSASESDVSVPAMDSAEVHPLKHVACIDQQGTLKPRVHGPLPALSTRIGLPATVPVRLAVHPVRGDTSPARPRGRPSRRSVQRATDLFHQNTSQVSLQQEFVVRCVGRGGSQGLPRQWTRRGNGRVVESDCGPPTRFQTTAGKCRNTGFGTVAQSVRAEDS